MRTGSRYLSPVVKYRIIAEREKERESFIKKSVKSNDKTLTFFLYKKMALIAANMHSYVKMHNVHRFDAQCARAYTRARARDHKGSTRFADADCPS